MAALSRKLLHSEIAEVRGDISAVCIFLPLQSDSMAVSNVLMYTKWINK